MALHIEVFPKTVFTVEEVTVLKDAKATRLPVDWLETDATIMGRFNLTAELVGQSLESANGSVVVLLESRPIGLVQKKYT